MHLIKIFNFSSLFGAEPINITNITAIEKGSADLIVYAIPVMVFFTILEIWYSWYTNRKSYNAKEALGSLFVGIGNVIINLLLKVALIYGSIYL